jgi:uncharacterized protein YqgC (DUF456 family)
VEIIVYKILFVLLYVVLTAVLLSTALGFPGNWILVGVALVIALISRFTDMTWGYLLLCAGLATLGEVIESTLGAVVVVRRGGTWWGVAGSVIGGFVGVISGAGVAPPFGSVLLGLVGAFTGAVVGEFLKQRQIEPAMRIGFWSFVGRMLAVAAKVSVGCVILWIIMVTTWP